MARASSWTSAGCVVSMPSSVPRRNRWPASSIRTCWGEQAQFDKLEGGRLCEFFELAAEGSRVDVSAASEPAPWARLLFRLVVAQCARKDLSPHLRRGLPGRWALLKAATQFARGRGEIPRLQPQFGAVSFDALERPFGGPTPEASEMLERYYRIKLSGLQFFGAP